MKKTADCYIVIPPGFEDVCLKETQALGLAISGRDSGGLRFTGGLRELYLAHLHLRSASRILVRLGRFRAKDFPELYRKSLQLPWGSFIPPGGSLHVRGTSQCSRLQHTGRIAETIAAAAGRALGVSHPQGGGHVQTAYFRLTEDDCVISIDATGDLLHRRGYRREPGAAPLRENLAAAVLLSCGFDGSRPFCDPLCGSGTITIEAALIATRRPPGANREFAFMHWPGYRPGLWQALLMDALKFVADPRFPLAGSDRSGEAVSLAVANAERAGVGSVVQFSTTDLAQRQPVFGPGLVLCNPPYGIRLESREDSESLFRRLGKELRRAFPGWAVALIVPEPRLAKATGLSLRQTVSFANGGIPVSLYYGTIQG